MKPGERRFRTDHGMLVLLEEAHELPIVDIDLALRTGSVHDPKGLEGVTRLGWRLVRMGTRELRGPEVEEAISRLGARLSIEISTSWVRIHGTVIRRNLGAFVELIASLLRRPALRKSDLAQVRRETLADLVAIRDNDRVLAARAFRRTLFDGHAYGRPVMGTVRTIRAIDRSHVAAYLERHLRDSNAVLGVAGDVSADELRRLVDAHLSGLGGGRAPRERIGRARVRRGRHVVLIDKPERTQTQIYIGTLGTRAGDPEYFPLLVANTAFGGTFTARLMQEVREKRGWSYGAYSLFGSDRQRDAWYMWTFPSAEQAADCIALELELLEGLVGTGPSAAEHRFARRYMVNSHCFDLETAGKRLEPRLDEELYELPPGYYRDYPRSVRAVTRAQSIAALRARLSPTDLVIALVATARELAPRLEALPGVRSLTVIPHDRD